jgi:hypothetical protein
MGKMSIRVDANVEGKTFKFAFKWEGGDEEIEHVMDFIEMAARKTDVTPKSFAQNTLRLLPTTGLMQDERTREVQMMAILYLVLQLPTNSPDRPGPIHNYAAAEDITAELNVGDDAITGGWVKVKYR